MPRRADPERRREVLDAAIDHLAVTGLAGFSLRTLATGLGQSTRVLTHHFADKETLLAAVLARLDERQHEALQATSGWDDPEVPVGRIVRDAWHRNLAAEERNMTLLIRELEGLLAAGRLPRPAPEFARGRAEFVAGCLERRGLAPVRAATVATLLNAAYSGLQADHLATGDTERTEAGLSELCAWADAAVAG